MCDVNKIYYEDVLVIEGYGFYLEGIPHEIPLGTSGSS